MKTNKVFKWLYGVFMFLPMLAIGVTCAYVTFNKNAKDSYYGETINEAQFTAISNNEVEQNKLVRYTSTNLSTLFSQNSSITINHLDNIQLTDGTSQTEILNANKDNINLLVFANNGTINPYISFRNGNDTILNLALQTRFTQFDFIPTTTQTIVSDVASLLEYVTFNKDSYLDNAFYYAVDQFNDSGFNKVDFVSYFDMFYNNTSIWTTFANTYMNYVLFVSLAFFIPRVLFWFINFAFSLVDGFSNKYKEW